MVEHAGPHEKKRDKDDIRVTKQGKFPREGGVSLVDT